MENELSDGLEGGVESMLKWVGVSVEGETRVDGINHFNCVKLQIQGCQV